METNYISLSIPVPKVILEGVMLLFHLRICSLFLMEMFHLLKFLNWYGKNCCNYNTYFSSNFSVLLWKHFFSCLDIFCLWCGNLLPLVLKMLCTWCGNFSSLVWKLFAPMKTKNFHIRDEKFPHQRQTISTPVWEVFVHAGPGRVFARA